MDAMGEPSRSQADHYAERVKAHTCTPEEQAGEFASECPKCKRKTLHQYTEECMAGCAVPPSTSRAAHEGSRSLARGGGAEAQP